MSTSSPNSKTDFEIVPPEVLKDFEYLLSENKKEVDSLDKNLEADYKILDLAIEERYPNTEYYYFRRYIIRSSKLIFELYNKIEELEEILKTRTIKKDSKFYSFLDINIGNIESLLD